MPHWRGGRLATEDELTEDEAVRLVPKVSAHMEHREQERLLRSANRAAWIAAVSACVAAIAAIVAAWTAYNFTQDHF